MLKEFFDLNSKTSKRALLMSALALVLCVVMLLGTSLAWFTDSVTGGGNVIKSGTLDVAVNWADGTQPMPAFDSADWQDASQTAVFDGGFWEPGSTAIRHIQIKNTGTLAMKYDLRFALINDSTHQPSEITVNEKTTTLADVIDVSYFDPDTQASGYVSQGTLQQVLDATDATASGTLEAGESKTLTVAFAMRTDLSNDYQNQSLPLVLRLVAVQVPGEQDSFDDQYDVSAQTTAAAAEPENQP